MKNNTGILHLAIFPVKSPARKLSKRLQNTFSMKKENFFSDVYDVVREVPSGRVTTYGAIANYLGMKRSARMVGWAMNAAHTLQDVPAHRVVNRRGILSGKHHFSTPVAMEEALQAEGVSVFEDQVQEFDKLFWDPAVELL